MKKTLPTFEFLIDENLEEDGVKAHSIVDDPAFQSPTIFFAKQKPKYIQLADTKGKKKKQICAGLSLIPNVLIYRVDDVVGEYNGFFSAETIEKIVEKYHEELNNNKVNLNHDDSQYIDAFMVSDYIVDSEEKVADLKRMGIEHKNIMGSWFTSFKIKDPNVFAEVINGGSKTGFSVEAVLDKVLVQMNKQINRKQVQIEMKKTKQSVLDRIVQIFNNKSFIDEVMNAEIFEVALIPELGFSIEWKEVGQPVQQVNVDIEGNETLSPIGKGEFITETGAVVVVDESSNLVEVREPVIEEAEVKDEQIPEGEVATGYTTPNEMAEVVAEITDPAMMPEVEPEVPAVDVKTKTIGELVGVNDGEYWIKVVVAGGEVTEAEVSSETDLLKQKLSKLENENKDLTDLNKDLTEKVNAPIGEPVLDAPRETKEWSKMTPYEKAMANRRG